VIAEWIGGTGGQAVSEGGGAGAGAGRKGPAPPDFEAHVRLKARDRRGGAVLRPTRLSGWLEFSNGRREMGSMTLQLGGIRSCRPVATHQGRQSRANNRLKSGQVRSLSPMRSLR
jgi:hypothetical protein